jgi:hypothetical protein
MSLNLGEAIWEQSLAVEVTEAAFFPEWDVRGDPRVVALVDVDDVAEVAGNAGVARADELPGGLGASGRG